MNSQKFTQRSLEAVQNAQNLAIENQNAQIEEEHLLLALLEEDNSLVNELLKTINKNEKVEDDVKVSISKKPKISGGARPKDGIYVSQNVDLILASSEKIAKSMK